MTLVLLNKYADITSSISNIVLNSDLCSNNYLLYLSDICIMYSYSNKYEL